MKIPDDVRESIYLALSEEADYAGWINLSDADKAQIYTRWARDPEIGGILTGFMGPQEVHKYLKDTIIKNYVIRKMEDPSMTLSILRIPQDAIVQDKWVKPHCLQLTGFGVVAWSSAQEWKTTLLAVYERAWEKRAVPHAAVLYNANGKFADASLQKMVNEVANRLEIQTIRWVS